ncbi:MAG: ATP-binding protein, partial [Nitrospirota bacterium]
AVLCSPLIADDEIIGFVLMGEDIAGESYGHDDFQLLKAISTQAAVQIKNIRLVNDLMTAKEVEAFGRMSSFIMHDLKNLTNSLSLVSQNARYNLNNPEFQKDAIKTIDSTVNRMKRLIGKLSATANRGIEINKERVDIKSQIDSAIKRLALTKNKNIAVINEINSIPQISVDSDAIEMVFFNLISNAYEAIGKDGRITVQASLSDGKVCIAVSDNGAGMSKEFMERELFKPFKTTKKSGFGIGLFQCKAIVEAHGGSIEVESEVGKGTVFAIRLPIG